MTRQLLDFKSLLLFLFPLFVCAQVGVNTTLPEAALDVTSTNNGVLIPRVAIGSALDVASVINPRGGALATSTLIYNTVTAGSAPNNVSPGFYYWNGSRWMPVGGNDWTLNGNTSITSPAAPATYGSSTIGASENYLGTTDINDVVIGTNNIERMRIDRLGNVGVGMANPIYKLQGRSDQLGSPVARFDNTSVVNAHGYGVYGHSINNPGWGFGGFFEGGYRGLSGQATGTTFTGQAIGVYGGSTGSGVGTRIGGYFSGSGGANNYGLIVPSSGGRIGLGTETPNLAMLQVEGVVGSTSSIFRANTNSAGIALITDWPALHFNSYFNGSIRAMSSFGYPAIINTDQSSGGIVFQTTNVVNTTAGAAVTVPERMRITGAGNVGIGTNTPTTTLHVAGTTRLVDGTQALGRVLTSDATGVGTWQEVGIDNVVGILSPTGINIPYNAATYTYTGSRIVLPPGKYAVNVTMLLSKASLTYSPNNSFFWVRSTFSNTTAAPTPSADIMGSNLCSGNYPGSSVYSLLTGTIIINNTSAANRTYYYCAGATVSNNTTETLTNFGGTYWAENNIIAYRLN